jgi:tryptophan-rich sensory protein
MSVSARYWLSSAAAGLLASFFTLRMGEIFAALRLPLFFPPVFLFPIGWTAALILFAHTFSSCKPDKKAATSFYVSLGLIVLWALLFFRLDAPTAAACAGLLLTGVWLHIRRLLGEKAPKAGKRLVLCCIWAGYLAYLNLGICIIN